MNIEMKMLIKRLNASTPKVAVEELKTLNCDGKEIQELVNDAIEEVKTMNDKEFIEIKTELLPIN